MPASCSRRSLRRGKQIVDLVELLGVVPPRLRDEGADAQIVLHGEAWKQPAVFRHVGDALLDHAMRRKAADRAAFERHRAARSGTSPEMTRISVVLPAPFGPITPTASPWRHFERHVEQGAEGAVTGGDRGKGQHAASGPSLAEIDLGHARIDRRQRGRALEDLFAMVEHDDAVDDAHQHAHDVLDPDDGYAHAAADAFEQVAACSISVDVEPAKAFVGEQEPRLGGERAGELELLQRGGAEPVGRRRRVGRQADQAERFVGAALRFTARDAAGCAVIGGERDVLDERQLAERPRNLERAGNSFAGRSCARESEAISAPSKRIDPAVGRSVPAIRLNVVALARAVRADEAENLALTGFEGDLD